MSLADAAKMAKAEEGCDKEDSVLDSSHGDVLEDSDVEDSTTGDSGDSDYE